jgi:DNA-binding transcriptional LysR family regulator
MPDFASRYLYEAAQSGSMRAAGERLGVAVSSISRQITQLEAQCGLPMIERGRRTVQLTEAGRLVVDHYKSRLANNEALQMQLEEMRGVKTGTIRIAVGEGFLGTGFTVLLDEFRLRNPLIRFVIEVAATAEIVQAVLTDAVHIGLSLQAPLDAKIRVRASIAEPLILIVAPDHALAAHTLIGLSEIVGHDLCLPPPEFRIRQILEAAQVRHGVFLSPTITTNSFLVMREAARSGHAATILPQSSVWDELRNGTLVGVHLADEGIEQTNLSLITRTGRQLEGAPLRFLTALESRLRYWTTNPQSRLLP